MKTKQYIFFGSRQYVSRISDNTNIKFIGVTLFPSQKVKKLGVFMDTSMIFDRQIHKLLKNKRYSFIFKWSMQ